MRRWGEEETHSYIFGWEEDIELAKKAVRDHVLDRNGKYDGIIFECSRGFRRATEVCRVAHVKWKGHFEETSPTTYVWYD